VDLALLDKEDALFLGWCFISDPVLPRNPFDKLEKHEWVLMGLVMTEVGILNCWKVVTLQWHVNTTPYFNYAWPRNGKKDLLSYFNVIPEAQGKISNVLLVITGDRVRDDLIVKRLWIRSNLDAFRAETSRDTRRRKWGALPSSFSCFWNFCLAPLFM
jgi:hypothetical protein